VSNKHYRYKKPLRAVHISNMAELKEKQQKNRKSKEEKMLVAGGTRLIMEDWINIKK